jgi:hypothetical protein
MICSRLIPYIQVETNVCKMTIFLLHFLDIELETPTSLSMGAWTPGNGREIDTTLENGFWAPTSQKNFYVLLGCLEISLKNYHMDMHKFYNYLDMLLGITKILFIYYHSKNVCSCCLCYWTTRQNIYVHRYIYVDGQRRFLQDLKNDD